MNTTQEYQTILTSYVDEKYHEKVLVIVLSVLVVLAFVTSICCVCSLVQRSQISRYLQKTRLGMFYQEQRRRKVLTAEGQRRGQVLDVGEAKREGEDEDIYYLTIDLNIV